MALKVRKATFTGTYRNTATGVVQSPQTTVDQAVLVQSVSTAPHSDHPFAAYSSSRTGAYFSGKGGYVDNADAYSTMYNSHLYGAASAALMDANAVLAMTNPGRAEVLTPVFHWEARDIPHMILAGGRALLSLRSGKSIRAVLRGFNTPRDLAGANLALQFGWAPLIGDLHKLANFGDAVTKRTNELQRLSSPKGLRRRVGPWETQKFAYADNYAMFSAPGIAVFTNRFATVNTKSWAVVHWKPKVGQSYFNNPLRPMPLEIRRILSGVTAHHLAESAWEALPWSWLIDWVIPVQNLLQAGNRIVASPSSGVIMTTTTFTVTTEKRPTPPLRRTWHLGEGRFETVHHRRILFNGPTLPTASIPLLGPSQLSVLGSLAVMRAR